LVLHWTFKVREHVAGIRQGMGEGARVTSLEDFLVLVAQLLESEHAHGLPSSILRIGSARREDSATSATEQLLSKLLPPASILTKLPDGGAAVLLPFAGSHDANALQERIEAAAADLRITSHLVAGPAKAQEMWASIIGK
jgi:hypothetical protein